MGYSILITNNNCGLKPNNAIPIILHINVEATEKYAVEAIEKYAERKLN